MSEFTLFSHVITHIAAFILTTGVVLVSIPNAYGGTPHSQPKRLAHRGLYVSFGGSRLGPGWRQQWQTQAHGEHSYSRKEPLLRYAHEVDCRSTDRLITMTMVSQYIDSEMYVECLYLNAAFSSFKEVPRD